MAAQDVVDGRSLADQLSVSAAGGYRKKAVRVCNDGAYGLVVGCLEILSGQSDIVLVTAWSKCSEGNMNIVTNLQFDPFYLRPVGFNEINSLALQAARYAEKYGVTDYDAARISIRNFSNGQLNPHAQRKIEPNEETILKAKVLSSPLKESDVCTYTDGACSILLASDQTASKLTDQVVRIYGFGWSTDSYYPGDRDLSEIPSLQRAASQAYKASGLAPAKIDVIENCGRSNYHEMMLLEELGFCEKGRANDLISKGTTSLDGRLPTNPSGGIMVSNPYVASGLVRTAEIALQVSGSAEERQVNGAKIGLAHGTSGPFMQSNCVVIMGA